jgi:hypothetical protein
LQAVKDIAADFEIPIGRVASEPSDPATGWYLHEFGRGVMIADPKVSGRTFIPVGHLAESEDLEFLSRPA